jgi:hypothetical protein
MIYAVTVRPLNTTFFLAERPEDGAWEIEEGVSLDVPPKYLEWPEGTERPQQLLCVSSSDPRHYKVFRYTRDIDREAFRETGRNFGGLYSQKTWGRFVQELPGLLEDLGNLDDESAAAPVESARGSAGNR